MPPTPTTNTPALLPPSQGPKPHLGRGTRPCVHCPPHSSSVRTHHTWRQAGGSPQIAPAQSAPPPCTLRMRMRRGGQRGGGGGAAGQEASGGGCAHRATAPLARPAPLQAGGSSAVAAGLSAAATTPRTWVGATQVQAGWPPLDRCLHVAAPAGAAVAVAAPRTGHLCQREALKADLALLLHGEGQCSGSGALPACLASCLLASLPPNTQPTRCRAPPPGKRPRHATPAPLRARWALARGPPAPPAASRGRGR